MKKTFLILLGSLLLASPATAQKKGKLFNGKDLSGWNIYLDKNASAEGVVKVVDGTLHIEGKPFGFVATKDQYSDFTLELQWRWVDSPSNSGIFLFAQPENKLWPNAIECQLCAGDAGDFVLLGGSDIAEFKTPEGKRRPAFPVVKKHNPSNEKTAGEWNSARIICRDGSITVYINDVLQNKGTNSAHKKGHIALQSEGGPIQFKDIRVKPLK